MIDLSKKNFARLLVILFAALPFVSESQCTSGLTANTTSSIAVSGTAWQTVAVASGGLKYIDFSAVAGNTYAFAFRSCIGGSCSFDEQISILTTGNVADGGLFGTSTQNISATAGAEVLYWSPNSSATYRIVISATGCAATPSSSVLAYTSIPSTTNFALWLGFTNNLWDAATFTNWARRAASGYPTHTTVPESTDDVYMNSGNSSQPDAGNIAVTCNNLTVQPGVTLTLDHTSSSLAINGNFTMNGTLNHIGYVYIYFYGVGKTISGTGNFYGGTICPLRFTQGSSYTLGTLAGNALRATHIYIDWTSGAGGTFSIGANTLSTHFFFQKGTFNQNTGTLEISGPNNCQKTYAPLFLWANADATNPYITNARFSAGTGTTYYNAGDFTNSNNYVLSDQLVRSASYYNLKIRTNNGFHTTIGDHGTAFTVANNFEIYNPGTAGGTATLVSAMTVNGNILVGNTGNALSLTLAERIDRSVAGTGTFTMGNNNNHKLNITYAHATNWAISIGAAGITTPLTFYGTVNYDQVAAQKVMGSNYKNLIISGTGAKTLSSNTEVAGDLTIHAGSSLDVTASNYNLDLGGEFINDGTFVPQLHTLTFKGTIPQNITNTAGTTNTYTASISGTIPIPDGTSPAGGQGSAALNTPPSINSLVGAGASLSITVPAGTYTSLTSIKLSITHSHNADIDAYLVSPSNTVLVISTDNGGTGDGYMNVTFSDAAATVPPTTATTFNGGTYKPEGQPFSSYGGPFAGTWTLYAIDYSAPENGHLTDFSITLGTAAKGAASTLNLHNTTINNSSTGITTNNNISVHAAATVALTSGAFFLNSNTLILNNPATAAITAGSNTSYIVSETDAAINPSIIQWKMGTSTGAHVFPFGVNGSYIPFTFNKTTAGSADISVSTRATAAANNLPLAGVSSVAAVNNMSSVWGGSAAASVIDRWWDITASAPVTADLKFTYRGTENTLTNSPTGTLAAQHWNGTAWNAPVGAGTGVTSGTGSVSVTAVSNFSPWILVARAAPLPIELLSFTGKKEGAKNRLEWKTATELNNDYFTIERSADANIFEPLIQVDGAGNSLSELNYFCYDLSPFNGVTYYRLKQTDYNGTHTYSSVIALENISNKILATVYPNPVADNLNLSFYSPVQGTVKIVIYDYAERIIINKEESVNEGQSVLNTDMKELSKGFYTMVLSFDAAGDFRSVTKIIKN